MKKRAKTALERTLRTLENLALADKPSPGELVQEAATRREEGVADLDGEIVTIGAPDVRLPVSVRFQRYRGLGYIFCCLESGAGRSICGTWITHHHDSGLVYEVETFGTRKVCESLDKVVECWHDEVKRRQAARAAAL